MKRLLLLTVVIALGIVFLGGSQWHQYKLNRSLSVTADTLRTGETGFDGDSTVDSINYYLGPTYGYKSLKAQIIVSAAGSDYGTGSGNSFEDDSGKIWIYSNFEGQVTLIDSAVKADLPCSLYTWLADDVGDTVLGEDIFVKVWVYDSTHDTLTTAVPGELRYRTHINVLLK